MKRILLFLFLCLIVTGAQADDHRSPWSKDDEWKLITNGTQEIYIRVNAGMVRQGRYGKEFRTYFVTNLPESNIVGAAQSAATIIKGDCHDRTYETMGSIFFSGKNKGGMDMGSQEYPFIRYKVVSRTLFEEAFDYMCKNVETVESLQKRTHP